MHPDIVITRMISTLIILIGVGIGVVCFGVYICVQSRLESLVDWMFCDFWVLS